MSEAAAAGQRSAASVIREAIDVYFGDADADADARRAKAAREFLELTASPLPGDLAAGPEELKAERDADADAWYDRVVSR